MPEVLWALPWLLLSLAAPLLFGRKPRIDAHAPPPRGDAPLTSVIIPARNEAENIGACAASLLASRYPNQEIVIVDDGSTDGTGHIVRRLAEQAGGRVRVVEGEPLPPGWLGKCWACWQGYLAARGDILVFADADTRHHPDLVGHAVGTQRAAGVDLLSLIPRQVMDTFWERVILPHVFVLLRIRWPDMRRINRTRNPRYAMANGQFLLFPRAAYEAIGGHEAVRSDVVEDMRLAQRIVASGRRLYLAHAEDFMTTRMYSSFGAIIEGWSKNLATGSRDTVPPWLRPFVPWAIALAALAAWVLPPAVLAASLMVPVPPIAAAASTIASAALLGFWLFAGFRLRVPARYALAYPLGGLMTAFLFFRSAIRGEHVRWKGRSYRMPPGS